MSPCLASGGQLHPSLPDLPSHWVSGAGTVLSRVIIVANLSTLPYSILAFLLTFDVLEGPQSGLPGQHLQCDRPTLGSGRSDLVRGRWTFWPMVSIFPTWWIPWLSWMQTSMQAWFVWWLHEVSKGLVHYQQSQRMSQKRL